MIAIQYTSGLYQITLNRGTYKINGEIKEISNSQLFQIDFIDDIYQITKKSVVDYYQNTKIKESILTSEKYDEKIKELTSKGCFDDEEDYEWCFDSIDDEFAYKKFKSQWFAKHKEIITESKIEFKVIKSFKSDYDFITAHDSIINHNTMEKLEKTGEFICNYHAQASTWAKEIFESFGYTYIESKRYQDANVTQGKQFTFGTHSLDTLEYTKADGEYVNNIKIRLSPKTSTYKECVEQYKKDYGLIKSKIERHVKKHILENAEFSAKDFLQDVERIKRCVSSINYKQKSYSDYHVAIKVISELENKILNLAEIK